MRLEKRSRKNEIEAKKRRQMSWMKKEEENEMEEKIGKMR